MSRNARFSPARQVAQLSFRGQPISRLVLLAQDMVSKLIENLAGEVDTLHGSQHINPLVSWSDQLWLLKILESSPLI